MQKNLNIFLKTKELQLNFKYGGCETAFEKFCETKNFDKIILIFTKFRDNYVIDFRIIYVKIFIYFLKN